MADEMIEEWDWRTGRPTGRAVARDEAHRTGIPHEGVHLWIISAIDDIPHILLQRRAKNKQFYPGYLDITVGGHVEFGQKEDKLDKEAYEELGIIPPKESIIDLGYFRYEETIPEFSLVHREFQRIWLLFDNRQLDRYRFNDGEVDALAAVVLDEFRGTLMTESLASGYLYDGITITRKIFDSDAFHPLFFKGPMVDYMRFLFEQIDNNMKKKIRR